MQNYSMQHDTQQVPFLQLETANSEMLFKKKKRAFLGFVESQILNRVAGCQLKGQVDRHSI